MRISILFRESSGGRWNLELGDIAAAQPKTDLRYLREMDLQHSQAKVIKVVPEKRTHAYLILNQTIFHPKGGGQPSDRGIIRSHNFEAMVKKAIHYNGVIIHWVKLNWGNPIEGEVACELDWPHRHLIMRRHTAAHLLDHCLAQALETRVQTTDSWVDEPCYVGYVGREPSEEALRRTEALANRMIAENPTVTIRFLSSDEARELLRNAPNYERLPDLSELRIVTIDGCQPIPCGGTHVSHLADVGAVSVLSAERFSSDSFRLHFSVSANASSS